jgi:hypothetical protein
MVAEFLDDNSGFQSRCPEMGKQEDTESLCLTWFPGPHSLSRGESPRSDHGQGEDWTSPLKGLAEEMLQMYALLKIILT